MTFNNSSGGLVGRRGHRQVGIEAAWRRLHTFVIMFKTVTREELYEALWQTPMNKLAAEWGVAIAGIVRACNAMDVPRPGVGHWQCVAKGWVMAATPLPAATAKTPASVTLKPAAKRMLVETQVKLSEDLRELHPLVRALYTRSKDMPAIDSGKVSVAAAGKGGVWVSQKHRPQPQFES